MHDRQHLTVHKVTPMDDSSFFFLAVEKLERSTGWIALSFCRSDQYRLPAHKASLLQCGCSIVMEETVKRRRLDDALSADDERDDDTGDDCLPDNVRTQTYHKTLTQNATATQNLRSVSTDTAAMRFFCVCCFNCFRCFSLFYPHFSSSLSFPSHLCDDHLLLCLPSRKSQAKVSGWGSQFPIAFQQNTSFVGEIESA